MAIQGHKLVVLSSFVGLILLLLLCSIQRQQRKAYLEAFATDGASMVVTIWRDENYEGEVLKFKPGRWSRVGRIGSMTIAPGHKVIFSKNRSPDEQKEYSSGNHPLVTNLNDENGIFIRENDLMEIRSMFSSTSTSPIQQAVARPRSKGGASRTTPAAAKLVPTSRVPVAATKQQFARPPAKVQSPMKPMKPISRPLPAKTASVPIPTIKAGGGTFTSLDVREYYQSLDTLWRLVVYTNGNASLTVANDRVFNGTIVRESNYTGPVQTIGDRKYRVSVVRPVYGRSSITSFEYEILSDTRIEVTLDQQTKILRTYSYNENPENGGYTTSLIPEDTDVSFTLGGLWVDSTGKIRLNYVNDPFPLSGLFNNGRDSKVMSLRSISPNIVFTPNATTTFLEPSYTNGRKYTYHMAIEAITPEKIRVTAWTTMYEEEKLNMFGQRNSKTIGSGMKPGDEYMEVIVELTKKKK